MSLLPALWGNGRPARHIGKHRPMRRRCKGEFLSERGRITDPSTVASSFRLKATGGEYAQTVDPSTVLHPRPPVRRGNVEGVLECTVREPGGVRHSVWKRPEYRIPALYHLSGKRNTRRVIPASLLCLAGGDPRRNRKQKERSRT